MKRALLAFAAAALVGCGSGGEVDVATLASNSDQIIWEAGQKALAKKQYDGARQHFKRIIDGFPQSPLGPGARLALGESYYREGGAANYVLGVSAYRDFLTLYPSHPRSDEAQFQVAEGFYAQRNGPDRDQTPTRHALEEYERLLEFYPASPRVATARERVVVCRQSLARSEFLAGYFYQRTRKACRSALFRYEGILRDYPDFEDFDLVLLRMAQCLATGGRGTEALPQLARLLAEFPSSRYLGEAQRLKQQIEAGPTSLPPAPEPQPSPAQPSPTPTGRPPAPGN